MAKVWHKRKLSKKEVKARKKDKGPVVQEEVTKQNVPEPAEKKVIEIGESVVVRDFASLLNVPVTELIKVLMKNGVLAAINETIDWETAAIVGDEFGFEIKLKKEEIGPKIIQRQKAEGFVPRPPIVTVMGHVDHGKTQLLDRIRKSDVISTESGGITQHIGVYQIAYKGKKITFIDTPGHEAFEAMRAHGADITDIVILVVAADEGVKPQTVEAYEQAKKAGVPIIVAINKIDLPNANIQKTKQMLSEIGLVPEDMGGQTICVPISAKQNINIDELLEMVLLVAEMKGFKANPNRPAIGVVVESRLDPKVGPVAFLLIQDGTLKKGDFVVVGETWGKIRLIEDEHGHNLKTAGPSKPVKVTGLKAVPSFGQVLQVVPDEKTAQQVLVALKKTLAQKEEQKTFKKIGLPIILKADVLGSLKALTDNIKKIETDEVAINIVKEGVGNITEDDVMMARATKAEILGFKVKPFASAFEIAQKEKVKISIYDVIYNLINDLKERIASMLKKEEKTVVGKGRILKIFLTTPSEKIVGFKVLEGQVQKGNYASIQRKGKEIGKGKVLSLQIEKEPVNEIKAGSLGGLKLSGEVDLEQEDILEFYKEQVS